MYVYCNESSISWRLRVLCLRFLFSLADANFANNIAQDVTVCDDAQEPALLAAQFLFRLKAILINLTILVEDTIVAHLSLHDYKTMYSSLLDELQKCA